MQELRLPSPPWSRLGRLIESRVRKALYDFEMLEENTPVMVALSGGKDSLTLLFMLKAILGRGFPKLDLHATLVDGEFSCGSGVNQEYLTKICESLGVNFLVKQSTQKLETLECYSCSRERRSLLFRAAKEVGAKVIAFGHHQDDSAETTLMNLLHKAEFAGNLPKIKMVEYGVTIIRPLIFVPEKDILTFAKQEGFIRALCRCPVGQQSMRKKVDDLISEIEKIFPNARENIAKAALLFGSDKAKTP